MQLLGVGQTAVGEPKFFVESLGVDNKRVALPLRHGPTIIKRVVRISAKLSLLSPSVRVDDSVVVIAATDEDKYSFPIGVLNELNSIASLELARPAGRFAKQEHWIVFQEIALAQLVQVPRPALERSNLIDISNVSQEAVGIHLDIHTGLQQSRGAWTSPISRLSRR